LAYKKEMELRRSDDSIAKQALQWMPQCQEEEDDRETLGKKIWRAKCGQRTLGSTVRKWRRQHRTELGVDEWSVAYAALEVTRHMPQVSQVGMGEEKVYASRIP